MSKPFPSPRVTANAVLLSGFIAGSIGRSRNQIDGPYRAVEADAADACTIIEHENGNRYAVTVRQIAGDE